ncbi:hypothetical protein PENSTE_c002G08132 [Penicillium steckii]|uniref:Zn(2)-C6 fungal-type domain-containing protein n=1 Tax=Penicillium steckii TaxID=303698 RepID=A0A1V6TU61_9EURO|nr:hypothetical protein PENSTE_c002G08132 [Penicillium steckii]
MPANPLKKSCGRCKKKHDKCDKAIPHCRQCIAAGVECPGYDQIRKFIDGGVSIKRHYPAAPEIVSMEIPANDLSDEGQYQKSDMELSISQDQARQDLKDGSSDKEGMIAPYRTPPLDSPENHSQKEELSKISWLQGDSFSVNDAHSPGNFEDRKIDMDYKTQNDAAYDGGQQSLESYSQTIEVKEFQSVMNETISSREADISLLSHHFVETIGPWLDLSDSRKFFSNLVPIRAIGCAPLRYSMAALAAKQLGRIKWNVYSSEGSIFINIRMTETIMNANWIGWDLKAENYYYLATSNITTMSSDEISNIDSKTLKSPISLVQRWLIRERSIRGVSQPLIDENFEREIENMLAVAVLLTTYKLLDAKGEEWHSHLAGVYPMLNLVLGLYQPGSEIFSHGIRASFWNFARQDVLGSYFSCRETYINPWNLQLWRAAGIWIDELAKFHIVFAMNLSPDDQAANGLYWLASKMIAFLTNLKLSELHQSMNVPSTHTFDNHDLSAGPNGQSYFNTIRWLDLCTDFQNWFDDVSKFFQPCMRFESSSNTVESLGSGQSPFPIIFYHVSCHAAAIQHYHFWRLVLLLNQPINAMSAKSTALDRLQSYRQVVKEVDYRCREICGIGFGCPQGEIRVYMAPLLLAVGRWLENTDERERIVDLLRDMENDHGWATDFAVQFIQSANR